MASLSRTSPLRSQRSLSPSAPVQPDHFYGSQGVPLPPSPHSDFRPFLDPDDDPLANRGIPVFKPTMEEFQDFEGYMNRVERWGSKSGIVKVIPPKEWTKSLPDLKPQLSNVKINSPIEQVMLGNGGLFRQENMVRRKWMSVREWVELCSKDEFRAPGVHEVGLSSRSLNPPPQPRSSRKGKQKAANPTATASIISTIKEEPIEDGSPIEAPSTAAPTPPTSDSTPPPATPPAKSNAKPPKKRKPPVKKEEPKPRPKRSHPSRAARDATLAEREQKDREFLPTFNPHTAWLPPYTKAEDYTPEFCQKLERQYWRNLGLAKSAWYGADTQGSLFTDDTTAWNVAHLPSALSRLLPADNQGLPGVNTPYLYFGMWRATFSWHVEDMDLFSINYIHFGAPKFWYAIPQGKANSMENVMRGYFPSDGSKCPEFLRHKSFLASPSILANSACRPNHLVQQPGEFVITFPRGYHAGFNLGLNCAESVNFALDSWIALGRKAKACKCVSDSVRIDVDALLLEREAERNGVLSPGTSSQPENGRASKPETHEGAIPPLRLPSRKRKPEPIEGALEQRGEIKKIKIKALPTTSSRVPTTGRTSPATSISKSCSIRPLVARPSVTLKLGPPPNDSEHYACCLCVSPSTEGLLKVQDPPHSRKDALEGASYPRVWMAHELCASIVPETWVDEVNLPDGGTEKIVLGVDAIVKDRWNLKCSACTKSKARAHGAPVQCTKGKCPKAFHVNCAKDGGYSGILFSVIREVDKEVVLADALATSSDSRFDEDCTVDSNPLPTGAASRVVDERPVLKVIKKVEAQILCSQHNPAETAKKKNMKQEKIRNELLNLQHPARIKIRVSAGVFEVTLVRVIEETGSVEVVWDKGTLKEFKWGSVVFGNPGEPVLQRPSEITPETSNTALSTQASQSTTPQTKEAAGSGPSNVPLASTVAMNPNPYSNPTYPTGTGAYDYWSFASQQARYTGQAAYPFTYTGYYPIPPMTGMPQSYYGFVQACNNQYRNGQLNWQQPYQGPTQTPTAANNGPAQPPPSVSTQPTMPQSSSDGTDSTVETRITQANEAESSTTQQGPLSKLIPNMSNTTSATNSEATTNSEQQRSAIKELAALSSLTPVQIADALSNNSELRDLFFAAVNQANGTS